MNEEIEIVYRYPFIFSHIPENLYYLEKTFEFVLN